MIKQIIQDTCKVCVKEFRHTFKDEGMLMFFILVPLFYPLLYAWIYSTQYAREVPVAVVDNCNSNESRKLIRMLDASSDVKVASRCINMEDAKEMIGRQEAWGIVYIPSDFSKNIMRNEQSTVSLFCDMSIMLHYKAIFQTLTAITSDMNTHIQLEGSKNFTKRDEEISTKPLDFDEVAIFNPSGGYADFIIPGVLILILHQTLLLGIGLSAGTEREKRMQNVMQHLSTYANGTVRIVIGKAMCFFIIYLFMASYVTMFVPELFGIVQLVHFGELLAFLIPFLLASIFFAMMLSCLVRYRENVMLLVVFTSVPLLFLSGISWPQSAMPGAWQGIAMLFPSTFGVRGFVRMNTMGATLNDIQPEYIALWIQAFVYFVGTCIIKRIKKHEVEMLKKKALEEGLAKEQNLATEQN